MSGYSSRTFRRRAWTPSKPPDALRAEIKSPAVCLRRDIGDAATDALSHRTCAIMDQLADDQPVEGHHPRLAAGI